MVRHLIITIRFLLDSTHLLLHLNIELGDFGRQIVVFDL